MMIPTSVWERLGLPLLLLAFLFLMIVLIPGIGHEVNGSRRWLRAGFMNFQASELARVLLLTYLASYVVRKQAELKQDLKGFLKPLGVLMGAALLLLLEPDFGAATVLMATGLGRAVPRGREAASLPRARRARGRRHGGHRGDLGVSARSASRRSWIRGRIRSTPASSSRNR